MAPPERDRAGFPLKPSVTCQDNRDGIASGLDSWENVIIVEYVGKLVHSSQITPL
jgi:hypothetical protein